MPVPENRLKVRLGNGDKMPGLWLSLTSSYVAELVGYIGFDWLLIDGEHAPNDLQTIMHQLQVLKSSESPVIVRPPIGQAHLIKQYLDMGVQSFLIPMIESREQAEEMVKAVRYPPHGVRGVGAGSARASHFSHISNYMGTANDQICLILQIESRKAIAALDDIASLDGVDCLFIGPSDLSADMGYLGNPFADEVQAVIADAIRRIRAHGKAAGIYMTHREHAQRYFDMGVNMVAVGADAAVLVNALTDLKNAYK